MSLQRIETWHGGHRFMLPCMHCATRGGGGGGGGGEFCPCSRERLLCRTSSHFCSATPALPLSAPATCCSSHPSRIFSPQSPTHSSENHRSVPLPCLGRARLRMRSRTPQHIETRRGGARRRNKKPGTVSACHGCSEDAQSCIVRPIVTATTLPYS